MDDNKRDDILDGINNLENGSDDLTHDTAKDAASFADETVEAVEEKAGVALEEIKSDIAGKEEDAVEETPAIAVSAVMAEDTIDTSVKKPAVKENAAKVKPKESSGAQKQGQTKSGTLNTWFRDIKAEFHKIIWPNRKELGKMTLTVIVTSLLFGILIAGLDVVFNSGHGLLIDLFKTSA